jgi:hypothetical protein
MKINGLASSYFGCLLTHNKRTTQTSGHTLYWYIEEQLLIRTGTIYSELLATHNTDTGQYSVLIEPRLNFNTRCFIVIMRTLWSYYLGNYASRINLVGKMCLFYHTLYNHWYRQEQYCFGPSHNRKSISKSGSSNFWFIRI